MGDVGDHFRDIQDMRRAERASFGTPCKECIRLLPKAHPSILLPGQKCRMHAYRAPQTAEYTQYIADKFKDNEL